MKSNAEAMLKPRFDALLKQSELDADVEGTTPVPATEVVLLSDPTANEALALRIATRQLKHLDELAHIDYDLCLDDPDVRAVVAETLRWGALMELEKTGGGW